MRKEESKIKAMRLKRGMSRAELASKTGIPLRTLENWEAGKHTPSTPARIKNIAKILECEIDELI